TSLPELNTIFRASTIEAVTLLALDYVLLAPNVYGTFFFGKITIVLYWVLQMFLLAGPRIAYRYFRYTRTLSHTKADGAPAILFLGEAADTELILRAMESGAVQRFRPVGILSPSPEDRRTTIRAIPVLGALDDLETVVAALSKNGTQISRVILTPNLLASALRLEGILLRARRLGIASTRLPDLHARGEAAGLAPIKLEDLLFQTEVKI